MSGYGISENAKIVSTSADMASPLSEISRKWHQRCPADSMFFYHYSLEFETILNPTLGSRSSRLMINQRSKILVLLWPRWGRCQMDVVLRRLLQVVTMLRWKLGDGRATTWRTFSTGFERETPSRYRLLRLSTATLKKFTRLSELFVFRTGRKEFPSGSKTLQFD
jgi:hypothetical protein